MENEKLTETNEKYLKRVGELEPKRGMGIYFTAASFSRSDRPDRFDVSVADTVGRFRVSSSRSLTLQKFNISSTVGHAFSNEVEFAFMSRKPLFICATSNPHQLMKHFVLVFCNGDN